jgi:hypothetical protein
MLAKVFIPLVEGRNVRMKNNPPNDEYSQRTALMQPSFSGLFVI